MNQGVEFSVVALYLRETGVEFTFRRINQQKERRYVDQFSSVPSM